MRHAKISGRVYGSVAHHAFNMFALIDSRAMTIDYDIRYNLASDINVSTAQNLLHRLISTHYYEPEKHL